MQLKLLASQFPNEGEFGAERINAWPFLLCQKPIVAVSPAPRLICGGVGVNFTLAPHVEEHPVTVVTVTPMEMGLPVSVPAAQVMVVVFEPAVIVPFRIVQT
jgi:hypothetical protein